ncbi:MAG: sulfate permease [Candidatus Eremiobacteraeota bacterium]|nr:sulfate permease [Candidatus Eremiobacteraeota bacterium]
MANLKKDIASSIAVGLVAIPLCLGIAHASGTPLISGLIAGIVGGLVIGSFSKSHLAVSGPAAGLTTIVLAAIATLKDFDVFLTAVVLAGVLQVLFGKMRVGGLSRLFPSPVIKGMLSAIGLILIMKQFPHLVGFDKESFGVEEFFDTDKDIESGGSQGLNTFRMIGLAFASLEPGAFTIGLSSLALLYFWDWKMAKRFPIIPGSLVAVGVAVLGNQVLGPGLRVAGKHLVKIPELRPDNFVHPNWGALSNPQVYLVALTIALVASVESLLSVEALDRLDPQNRRTPPNAELLAQGIGNIISGLLGGLPITAVIVRGSVNLAAGATSKRSAILHGAWILVACLGLRNGINAIPLAALAAVLVHVGIKMAHPKNLKEMSKRGWSQLVPYVVTVLAILFTDLLIGICIGTVVSAFFILRNLHVAKGFTVHKSGLITQIKLHQEVTFFHKVRLSSVLEAVPAGSVLEIDGSEARTIDHDVLDLLELFKAQAAHKNIEIIFGGISLMESFSEKQMAAMQAEYETLLSNNQAWVEECQKEDPQYFERMAIGQKPTFLFIGCSDSRVPAEVITRTEAGKLFVHRNIANVVSLHDMNLMSVLQYSVEHLVVPHIIVCGHYGCGGVRAALSSQSFGLIDNWVHPIKKVVDEHQAELALIADADQKERRIIELHVLAQVRQILKTPVVQKSIQKLGIPRVHGWVYDLATGKIKDLKADVNLQDDLHPVFHYEYDFQKKAPVAQN